MNKGQSVTIKTKTDEKTFYEKLLSARQLIQNPAQGGDNKFKGYKYVTLQDLYDAALPPLMQEGLIVLNFKTYEDGISYFETQIIEASTGTNIFTRSVLNEKLKTQELGSELTYLSRYHLGTLLSLRTDKDDDGEIANKKEKEPAHEKKAKLLTVMNLLDSLPSDVVNGFYDWVASEFKRDLGMLSVEELTKCVRMLEGKKRNQQAK